MPGVSRCARQNDPAVVDEMVDINLAGIDLLFQPVEVDICRLQRVAGIARIRAVEEYRFEFEFPFVPILRSLAPYRSAGFFGRFDVNGDVLDTQIRAQQNVFHMVGDVVANSNRQLAVHDDLDVHKEHQATLAHPALVDSSDSFDRGR